MVAMGMPAVRAAAPDGAVPAGAPALPPRPDAAELIDRYGRVARDLRISLTEKCSLRCTYCMPEEGLPPIAAAELLSPKEIARLVGIAAGQLGVREVRLTGGEPLLRPDLEEIVARCRAQVPGLPLAMTSNGIGLRHRAAALRAAGLDRINISLDTVNKEVFAQLTRRDRLPAVLAGIRAARDSGLVPVKINAVLMPATISGAADLLQWCAGEGVALRFIEQMPLDADQRWARAQMVTAQQLLEVLGERFTLTPVGRHDPAAPAEEWVIDTGPATVGIIASVTRSFCGSCDRTRLTADGHIRSCLFSDDETDIRAALRSGASDTELADIWRTAMWGKSAGHGIDATGFRPPVRTMGAIGG